MVTIILPQYRRKSIRPYYNIIQMIGPYLRRQFLPEIFSLDVVAAKVIWGATPTCLPCPSGTFRRSPSSTWTNFTICRTCPAGNYSAPGSSSCTQCPPGSMSPAASSNCTICAAGKGFVHLLACFLSWVEWSINYPCELKLFSILYYPGSYSVGGQSILCAPGTFNGISNSTSCTACLTAVSVGTSTCGMSFRIC